MQPDLNFYGFTVFQEGKIFRQRIGTRNEGIISDVGPILEIEYETITRRFGRELLDEGLYVWHGDQVEGIDDMHFDVGVDVIFDLLALQTGVALAATRESTAFYTEDAFRLQLPTNERLTRFGNS